jgi:hypothetical protein
MMRTGSGYTQMPDAMTKGTLCLVGCHPFESQDVHSTDEAAHNKPAAAIRYQCIPPDDAVGAGP